MTRISIIEDGKDTRVALLAFFSKIEDFEVITSCSSFEEFKEIKNWPSSHIVLCDIGLPGRSGIDAAWYIKEKSPSTHVMMLTVFEDKDKIFQSLRAGASGYMLKSELLQDIHSGILDILRGGAAMSPSIAMKVISFFSTNVSSAGTQSNERLTAREIELLALLEKGFTNAEIAANMYLSVDTVKFHIKNIYVKLQVSSRYELLTKYRER